jgi:hypothetical protein
MLGQVTPQMLTDYFLNALATAGVDGANVESTAIDAAAFDRIRAMLFVGATATNLGTVKFFLTECATSGGTYTAMPGATIGTHTHGASGETAKIYVIDGRMSPGMRYVKVNYQRETQNTALLGGVYELYNNKQVPITKAANVKEQVVV